MMPNRRSRRLSFFGFARQGQADHRQREARDDVQAACAFCYSDAMDNRGYALIETPALQALLAAPPLIFR